MVWLPRSVSEERKTYIVEQLNPLLEEMVGDCIHEMPPDTVSFILDWLETRSRKMTEDMVLCPEKKGYPLKEHRHDTEMQTPQAQAMMTPPGGCATGKTLPEESELLAEIRLAQKHILETFSKELATLRADLEAKNALILKEIKDCRPDEPQQPARIQAVATPSTDKVLEHRPAEVLPESRAKPLLRIEGKEALANMLKHLQEEHGDEPESIWLFFDWDKTLKLRGLKDVEGDLPADAPQWKKDLAKDLRGGAATLQALEDSPFQKFIITAKNPQLGNPATGLVTEAGSALKDPIFLRMHKCFGMTSPAGTLKYTPPGLDTIEYTEDQTLKAASWDKVPKNELRQAKTVTDKDGKALQFPQNFQDAKDDGKWKFHGDVESTPCAPPEGEEHPANGGSHYFPYDNQHGGCLLKRVGNVYASGYNKHTAIAKAIQLAHKKQRLPQKIYFFDDNVTNAHDVHTLAEQQIEEVLYHGHGIQVLGIFWDPFAEEMAGECAITSAVGGSDFQLDGVLTYPNFRDDHRGAVEQGIDQVKKKQLEFYGLGTEQLVKRFEAYLPIWDEEAAKNGRRLGEAIVKSKEELEEEELSRQNEKLASQKAQADALAALEGRGPKKAGVAAIPDFKLESARQRRVMWKEELQKFLKDDIAYDALPEDCKKNITPEAGKAGAEAFLQVIGTELEDIQKRMAPKPKKGEGKGKDNAKSQGKGKKEAPKGKGNVGKEGKT